MRTTVLACWAVVATLVVVVDSKPYSPPVYDIAAAYQAYHQLWMSEARRNAVAPLSFSQQLTRPLPPSGIRKAAAIRKASLAEKPPQEKQTTETENPVVEERVPEPVEEKTPNPVEEENTQTPVEEEKTIKLLEEEKPVAAEQQTESLAVVEQTPEGTTEQSTQATTIVEPTATEQPVLDEVTTEMPKEEQTIVETTVASKQATPVEVLFRPTPSSGTDMKAAFDNFFARWNAERIRNAKPPRAPAPIPFLDMFLRQEIPTFRLPVTSKPVDPPAETPEPETPVDTLTKV